MGGSAVCEATGWNVEVLAAAGGVGGFDGGVRGDERGGGVGAGGRWGEGVLQGRGFVGVVVVITVVRRVGEERGEGSSVGGGRLGDLDVRIGKLHRLVWGWMIKDSLV